MQLRKILLAAAVTAFSSPVFASEINIADGYVLAVSPAAMAGAAFMDITNSGDTDDRLIGAYTDVAKKSEIHTHVMTDGVMEMRAVDGGLEVPAGGSHLLARGGDHVMLMGLTQPLKAGDIVTLTLIFEHAGEMSVELPVNPGE